MRNAAREQFGDDTAFLIGVNGSYARREATAGSDVDLFFLAIRGKATSLKERHTAFREFLKTDLGMKLPASNGVFKNPLRADKICKIGGQPDDNETLTRRMLFLLEGEWLFNKSAFHEVRVKLLKKYLYYRPEEDKICMFLLNDIIRYWRTICVDLEYKVYADNKAREIRLIKLRFSRMLLYASGVLAIGQGHGLSCEEKIKSLRALFEKDPIDRIQSVVGEKGTPILDLYAEFLNSLNTPHIRAALEGMGPDTDIFKDMSEKARLFRTNLHSLFQRHFPNDNPTMRAIVL